MPRFKTASELWLNSSSVKVDVDQLRFHNPPKKAPGLMLSYPSRPSMWRAHIPKQTPLAPTPSVRVMSRTHGQGNGCRKGRCGAHFTWLPGMMLYYHLWGFVGLVGLAGVLSCVHG